MSVVENVEKQIEVTYQATRDNLVAMKDTAYEKYVETWDSMEHIKDATLETISNAWEQAWLSYNSIVKQLQEYGHSSIQTAQSEYDAAKANLAARTNDVKNWITEHGAKWKEDATGLQADAYEKMGAARKEAYEKYLQSKEGLKGLFSEARQEASKDLEAAEKQLKKMTARLENHLANVPSDETKEQWEKSKAQMESAKQRAETELNEAKAHSESLGARVSGWSQEVIKTLKDESEFLTQRAKEIGDQISTFAVDSKEKVEDNTAAAGNVVQEKWNSIYKLAQEESNFALEMWNKTTESLAEYWHSAKEAVGLEEHEALKTPEPTHEEKTSHPPTHSSDNKEEVPIPKGSGVLLQG